MPNELELYEIKLPCDDCGIITLFVIEGRKSLAHLCQSCITKRAEAQLALRSSKVDGRGKTRKRKID
jgi:hypothetical protein